MKINWGSGAISGIAGGLLSGLVLIAAGTVLFGPHRSRQDSSDNPVTKVGSNRLYEIRLQDSTRCVVVQNPEGVAVSCDWK